MPDKKTDTTAGRGTRDLKELLSKIGAGLDTRTVFGEARVFEGRAVIPVASVSYGGCGGFSGGAGPEGEGEGEGMGLGFGVSATPLGVIEVTADDVRWMPTLDATKLVKTTIFTAAVLILVSVLAGACRGD